MKITSVASAAIATCMTAACLCAFAPAATAAEGTITSTKSFPAYAQVRQNLMAEATSTSVEDGSDWGGIESLNVPQTESQAEKEAAQKKAEEEAAAQQAAEEATQTASPASQSVAASRNTYRDTVTTVSAGAGASVDAAYGLIGQSMDCTMLVTLALAARGINFHGWPAEYANIPGAQVVTDGTMQAGDILIWGNAHVALYVGNGQAIHGGWSGGTVALAGLDVTTSEYAGYPSTVVRIP